MAQWYTVNPTNWPIEKRMIKWNWRSTNALAEQVLLCQWCVYLPFDSLQFISMFTLIVRANFLIILTALRGYLRATRFLQRLYPKTFSWMLSSFPVYFKCRVTQHFWVYCLLFAFWSRSRKPDSLKTVHFRFKNVYMLRAKYGSFVVAFSSIGTLRESCGLISFFPLFNLNYL